MQDCFLFGFCWQMTTVLNIYVVTGNPVVLSGYPFSNDRQILHGMFLLLLSVFEVSSPFENFDFCFVSEIYQSYFLSQFFQNYIDICRYRWYNTFRKLNMLRHS